MSSFHDKAILDLYGTCTSDLTMMIRENGEIHTVGNFSTFFYHCHVQVLNSVTLCLYAPYMNHTKGINHPHNPLFKKHNIKNNL